MVGHCRRRRRRRRMLKRCTGSKSRSGHNACYESHGTEHVDTVTAISAARARYLFDFRFQFFFLRLGFSPTRIPPRNPGTSRGAPRLRNSSRNFLNSRVSDSQQTFEGPFLRLDCFIDFLRESIELTKPNEKDCITTSRRRIGKRFRSVN